MTAQKVQIKLPRNAYYEVDVGSPFVPSIKAAARSASLNKFRVFLGKNGTVKEIKMHEAPPIIRAEDEIFVQPYDVAA